MGGTRALRKRRFIACIACVISSSKSQVCKIKKKRAGFAEQVKAATEDQLCAGIEIKL